MKTTPYWLDGVNWSFPPLREDTHAEVLVIGGGITGITTAWLLAREGVRVVLVDREDPARRDTGHTTAHLTYMTDTRLSDLVAAFGGREALLAWQAGAAAMDLICQATTELKLDCELKTVPGYLVAAKGDDITGERATLAQEAEWARQAGFDVRLIDEAPVTGRPGIRFADQMEFHPVRYLQGLAKEAESKGARIFANTEVTAFEDEPRRVKAGRHRIHYDHVVIATHVPLQGNAGTFGAALFQTKLALYSSYAVAARIPAASVKEMIWSDTADPFLYLRMFRTDLAPGEGKVMTRDGKRVAACRDASGEIHLCSAVSPHLGCIVAWNAAEGTWDCPCHGSRFTAEGRVIAGTAESDLKAIETAATS